jgi:hypothetical protein
MKHLSAEDRAKAVLADLGSRLALHNGDVQNTIAKAIREAEAAYRAENTRLRAALSEIAHRRGRLIEADLKAPDTAAGCSASPTSRPWSASPSPR